MRRRHVGYARGKKKTAGLAAFFGPYPARSSITSQARYFNAAPLPQVALSKRWASALSPPRVPRS